MKHQISIRRMLAYVALFAVGFGFIRFDEILDQQYNELGVGLVFVGLCCTAAGICCPIGYFVAGANGEVNGMIVALVVTFAVVVLLPTIYFVVMSG